MRTNLVNPDLVPKANALRFFAALENAVSSQRTEKGALVAVALEFLHSRKYATLISEALSAERGRLGSLLGKVLDDAAKNALAELLVRDGTLSGLAALQQDAKDFG